MKSGYSIVKVNFLLILLSLFPIGLLFSQGVGIGTTKPDTSSALEVNSGSRGLLIPRLSIQQRNVIPGPATSLVIYQTDGVPGFYSNSGTPSNPVWVQLLPNPSNTDLNLNNNKITNLIAPSSSSDATNKGYVDNLIAALGNKGIPTMISVESPNAMTMSVAMIYCDTLSEGGYTDWHIPSFEDLFFLSSGGVSLPDSRTVNYLWTSSVDFNANSGYYFAFRLSDAYWGISHASQNNRARCVR
jgi:hypothetical protein